MHRAIRAVIVAAIALAGGASGADSSAGFRVLVPSFKLSGSTDQKGTLKASLPLMVGWEDKSLILTPRLEVASSKGISILVSPDASLPWQAGASLTGVLVDLPDNTAHAGLANRMKIVAYNACVPGCAKDTNCTTFKADASPAEKYNLDQGKLCPLGKAAWRQFERGEVGGEDFRTALYDSCAVECQVGQACAFFVGNPLLTKLHPRELCEASQAVSARAPLEHPVIRGRYPFLRLSAGLQGGARKFSWLEGSTGDPGAELSKAEEPRLSTRFGLSASAVLLGTGKYGHTIELHGVIDSRWNESSDTAHVCKPVGSLAGAQAEQCSDVAINAPAGVTSTGIALDVGLVDRIDGTWRGAIGVLWEPTSAAKPARFSLRFPLYVNLVTAPAGYAGEYKGMLRVTPALSFSRDPVLGIASSGAITVEILGDANMFPEALDYL